MHIDINASIDRPMCVHHSSTEINDARNAESVDGVLFYVTKNVLKKWMRSGNQMNSDKSVTLFFCAVWLQQQLLQHQFRGCRLSMFGMMHCVLDVITNVVCCCGHLHALFYSNSRCGRNRYPAKVISYASFTMSRGRPKSGIFEWKSKSGFHVAIICISRNSV